LSGKNCLFLLNAGGNILLNDGTSELIMNDTSCSFGGDNCKFLLNAGGNILLNDGTSELQMNLDNCSVGPTPPSGGTGGSNTRVRKRVGKRLPSMDLGSKPTVLSNGESRSVVLLKSEAISRATLSFKPNNESRAELIPTTGGSSISKKMYPTKNESKAPLIYIEKSESWGIPHPSVFAQVSPKKESKVKKYLEILESIEKNFSTKSTYAGFAFNETSNDEKLIAFTHSSSFIGNVRYNTETQEMRVLLNGKAYNFCNVPHRIYDAFEGSNSKGAFFARSIRTQFNC
jgi:hypothetical protein